jgi:hypothetical protein
VEGGEQTDQVDVVRDWVAAGDGVPERDRVLVHHDGLVDFVANADRWEHFAVIQFVNGSVGATAS